MSLARVRKLVAVQRRLVFERAGGRCERCSFGLGLLWECHHRKLRSQGGDWSLANLLALHPACHSLQPGSVHLEPKVSYGSGFLVKREDEPRDTPVLLHGKRLVLLSPCGLYVDVEVPA